MMRVLVLLTLLHGVQGGFVGIGKLQAESEHIVPVPRHQYKQDCGTRASLPVSAGAASLLQNVPGAGIATFKPFETVLKDGFMLVDCVKDYMYYHGDKFGDNKHEYTLGSSANVSIVHYDAFVAKEDRVEMTQKTCFEFCRTVPNMGFFGITNGRSCYCTPYFTQMESDSSQCDAVCEGETTLMCGGKSKSSVFSMHMCASTEEDLGDRLDAAAAMGSNLGRASHNVEKMSSEMQNFGVQLQKTFGQVGDSTATGLAQEAKVFAGTLLHKAEDGGAAVTALRKLAGSAQSLRNFQSPETVTQAERIMEGIDEAVANAEVVSEELSGLEDLATGGVTNGPKADALQQYNAVMYFVDKEFETVPTTCSGSSVGKPIVGQSANGCAQACDSNIDSCVGFQYFEEDGQQLCFLLSGFKTGSYYTGCGSGKSFLQAAPFKAQCFAKLSKFEGTTLAPNPSGKCAQCFTKLTKADRCF